MPPKPRSHAAHRGALVKLGRRIRRVRKRRGLTQEALALKAGLAFSHVADLEAGKRDARTTTLVRVAAALAVPVEALFLPFSDYKKLEQLLGLSAPFADDVEAEWDDAPEPDVSKPDGLNGA